MTQFKPELAHDFKGNKVFVALKGEQGMSQGFLIDVPPGTTLVIGKDKNGDFSAYLEPGHNQPKMKAMNATEAVSLKTDIVPISYVGVQGGDQESLKIQGSAGKVKITPQKEDFKADVHDNIAEFVYGALAAGTPTASSPARPTTSVGYKP